MCNCDCELDKRERWRQERESALKGLLRNLTEVRNQQRAGGYTVHKDGVVDGLNIAIAAIKRRIR